MSSRFQDLIGVTDTIVLDEFGVPMRWTKTGPSTQDFEGILDLEVELLGHNGDVAYLGKAVTAKSSVLSTYKQGETIQELDSAGTPTGKVYRLQQTIENDGGFITIEVTS
jgi:hypothetical protein